MLDATPLLRLYTSHRRRRLAAQRPALVQERELMALLAKARDTRFGRDHGFGANDSVAEFQRRVPLRAYEDFWETYWRAGFPTLTDVTWPGTVPFFAVTSGTTTGATKFIPCTAEMNRSNSRAAADLLAFHLANRPVSRVLGGLNFMLGGSTDLTEQAPGIRSGDLSGIAATRVPLWAKPWFFPPPEIALIADWEDKVERLVRLTADADVRSVAATPSWLLIFIERLCTHAGSGRSLAEIWPNLELVVHGGVNFAPYRHRFADLLEGSHAELREGYAASEGFIAVADRGSGDGMRLMLDTGLFMEFVPTAELDAAEPPRHWLATVETGVEYAIAVTTCAGLWAYLIGDTVRFVDLDPPRILVTGRTAYMLSAFGEHLIDAEIEDSIAAAADEIAASVTDYSAGAVFPARAGDLGGHLYIIEFDEAPPDDERLAAFQRTLDAALSATNEDYEAHRVGGYGMAAPRVHAVPPGTFAAWMKSRGRLGGQNKVPRIITDQELFDGLKDFAGCPRDTK